MPYCRRRNEKGMILYLSVERRNKKRLFLPYCKGKNERTMILYLTIEGKMKER